MKEFYNAPLFGAVVSWVLAQLIKTVFYIIKHRTFNPERIMGAGGMPSSHSATVCSLAIIISRIDGIKSVEFALAMVLALVVMYDATGVRRAAGLHAKEINRLRRIVNEYENSEDLDSAENFDFNLLSNKKIEEITEREEELKELKEFLGHTPIEVLCGAVLGILIGMIIRV